MKLSEKLLKKAAYIRGLSPELVALDHLKQAGMSEEDARIELAQDEMEKTAASELESRGIDYDQALKMVKVAGVKVKDLDGFKVQKPVEEIAWETLTKMASEVEALEAEMEGSLTKVAELEALLDEVPEAIPETPAFITKLASSGNLTHADLEALMKIPAETLTKVASFNDAPASMGRPSGRGASTDPLLDFLMS